MPAGMNAVTGARKVANLLDIPRLAGSPNCRSGFCQGLRADGPPGVCRPPGVCCPPEGFWSLPSWAYGPYPAPGCGVVAQ